MSPPAAPAGGGPLGRFRRLAGAVLRPARAALKKARGFRGSPEPRVVRLDYPPQDIFIHVSTPAEEKWRSRSCSKEPWTVAWIESRVRADDVLYDVGANVGTFSLLAAKRMGEAGRVVSFEPGYASFARLCDNIVLNALTDKITPVGLPLSRRTEVMHFMYRSLESGQSRHVLGADRREKAGKYSQPVLAFRLDDLVRTFQLPLPRCMKIDVDGGETWMLEGAQEVLRAPSLRSVLVEVEGAQSESVTGLMTAAGLRLKERHQGVRENGEAKPAWYGVFERASVGGEDGSPDEGARPRPQAAPRP